MKNVACKEGRKKGNNRGRDVGRKEGRLWWNKNLRKEERNYRRSSKILKHEAGLVQVNILCWRTVND